MRTITSRPGKPETREQDTRQPATINPSEAPTRQRRVRQRPARQPFDAPPAQPSAARELARRALDVLRRARLASPPERWLQPAFGGEVDLVRLHLAPVRTRGALASSFGREAFNLVVDDEWPVPSSVAHADVPGAEGSPGPVHVGYALRWLELGDGRRRAAFRDWLVDARADAQMNTSRTR